jgi:hypothetical protein
MLGKLVHASFGQRVHAPPPSDTYATMAGDAARDPSNIVHRDRNVLCVRTPPKSNEQPP